MRFTKVTNNDGDVIWINVDHILSIQSIPGGVLLRMVDGCHIRCKGQPAESFAFDHVASLVLTK